jgi:hypothetical protein
MAADTFYKNPDNTEATFYSCHVHEKEYHFKSKAS